MVKESLAMLVNDLNKKIAAGKKFIVPDEVRVGIKNKMLNLYGKSAAKACPALKKTLDKVNRCLSEGQDESQCTGSIPVGRKPEGKGLKRMLVNGETVSEIYGWLGCTEQMSPRSAPQTAPQFYRPF